MLDLKGLWRDSVLRSEPKGFTPDVRNMVVNRLLGAYASEPGFDLWSQYLADNNLTPVGIRTVNYGRKIILSVTEDNLSEIGSFDSDANYTQILRYDLGFNVDYPMDIEFEYNTQQQLIIAFTDNLNTPKVFNVDAPPSPFSVSRIEMFPSTIEIKIASDVIDNYGNLTSGAYYPVFKYRNYDASESGWSEVGNPVYITNSSSNSTFTDYDGCPAGSPTNKGIQFTVDNVDQNYDLIVLGVVYKNAGVLTCYELSEQIVSPGPFNISLSNLSNATVITLLNILTPLAFYDRIKHLTQTNGVLYGAYVSEPALINLQQYTSLIELQWKSTLTNPLSLLSSYKVNDQNNKKKGFMHEEVYAFYCRYKLIKGGWTDYFHIPGPVVAAVDGKSFNGDANIQDIVAFDTSLQVDLSIDSACKYFQTRDTTTNLNSGTGTGTFGFWENDSEVYPDLDMYNSTSVGGSDLRGLPVRHFRFPTIRKLMSSFYSSNSQYGVSVLDELSIQITNFPTLPDEISSLIEGFEIGYAKRDANNSTVGAQDLVLCGSRRQADSGSITAITSWSASGNWNNRDKSNLGSPQHDAESLLFNPNYFRFHAFDLMVNKPAIGASYLSNHFALRRGNLEAAHAIISGPQQWSYHIDYTNGIDSSATALTNADELLFSIKNFQYIPNNTIVGKINNLNCETCAWAELVYGNNRLPPGDNNMNFGSSDSTLNVEVTYFTNIMNYKKNIYTNFYNQSLVSTGQYFLLSDTIIDVDIFGGDTYISQYGFMTYGPRTTRDTPGSFFPYLEPIDFVDWGVKVVRSFLCESYSNIGLRHQIISNQYSDYYPKSNIYNGTPWFLGYDIRQDWNQIQYNTDYSSVNDIGAYIPFNPFTVFINNHPNRIIRCIPSSNEQRAISWRTFLANDYFEIQRNRGVIINIQGTSENFVLINTEFSLFKTVGTEELQTDEFKVVLGSGDIFGRPPTESDNDELGYAGCQNKYSCLLTRYGYFFADAEKQKVFLTGRNLDVIDITEGLRNDFQNLMLNEGDNPYQNLGYTVSWDEKYRRILFSQVGTTSPFTFSYTPENQTWTSQHDYIPNLLFSDRAVPYSLIGGKIYKHNSATTVCEFYNGAIYDSYYVHVFNTSRPNYPYGQNFKPDLITKEQEMFFNISWKTDVILQTAKQRDLTINELLIWNSYQCTGDIELTPFDFTQTLLQQQDTCNTRRVKDIWMFNKFRDAVITNTFPFVINSSAIGGNIDQDAPFYMKKRFADDFLAVKFLFNNEKIGILSTQNSITDVMVNYSQVGR